MGGPILVLHYSFLQSSFVQNHLAHIKIKTNGLWFQVVNSNMKAYVGHFVN
jgi:hypothetical protein